MFPEIEIAVDNLRAAVQKTDAEIAELKQQLKSKKAALRNWQKMIAYATGQRRANSAATTRR